MKKKQRRCRILEINRNREVDGNESEVQIQDIRDKREQRS